ncbi:MAG: tRNA (adenosine(37)-N6)-threonylcarbamoyltransferase complex ATPase subunit type 1 TsaE [Brevinema sp.]
MHKFAISSIEELSSIAQLIFSRYYPSTVVLQGDLGTGKTSFVRSFMALIDPHVAVSSPTFSLMNIYQTNQYTVYHFDLYRLSGINEALEWGFDEFVDQGDFKFIEWAERAIEVVPRPYTLVLINHGNTPNMRSISIETIID